jgi:hypothetical protein
MTNRTSGGDVTTLSRFEFKRRVRRIVLRTLEDKSDRRIDMNGILTGERQKGPPAFIAVITSIGVRLHEACGGDVG